MPGVNYAGGGANLTLLVSDGQDFGPDDDGALRVNGAPLASGGIFQGSAPRAPGAGVDNGSLFDVNQYDISPFLAMGPNTLTFTLEPGFDDALSAIVAAVDLPAGAAVIPEPSTYALVGIALVVLARRLRRRA